MVHLLGISLVISSVIISLWEFIEAYMTPLKRFTIYIDNYHEANFEMWGIVVPTIFALIFVTYNYFRMVVKEEENEKRQREGAQAIQHLHEAV
jgi:hypothetical protein